MLGLLLLTLLCLLPMLFGPFGLSGAILFGCVFVFVCHIFGDT